MCFARALYNLNVALGKILLLLFFLPFVFALFKICYFFIVFFLLTTLAFQFHIIYMLTDSSPSEYLLARFTRLLISFVLLYFHRPQGGNMEVVNKLYAMYSLSKLQSLLWSYCDVYMIIIRHIGSKQSY